MAAMSHPADVITAEVPVIVSTVEAEDRRAAIAAGLDHQLDLIDLAKAVLREAPCSPQRMRRYEILVAAAGNEYRANRALMPLFVAQQRALARVIRRGVA